MNTKEDLLPHLARLQFTGKDGVYTLELKTGLSIHAVIEDNSYTLMPMIDVLKLLPRGKMIDDFTYGPADKFSWKMHVTSNNFNLEKFAENLSVVRNYLEDVADFYA